jgi:hypothetical protein
VQLNRKKLIVSQVIVERTKLGECSHIVALTKVKEIVPLIYL